MEGYTSIQIHQATRQELAKLKEYRRESYDEIIERLIAVFRKISSEGELSAQTLEDVETARRQVRSGKGLTTRQLLQSLGD